MPTPWRKHQSQRAALRMASSQHPYARLESRPIGSRVRQLRGERGFSQAALAQMLRSPGYLNQIEHDVRPLTVAVLLRITEVFRGGRVLCLPRTTPGWLPNSREVTLDRDLNIAIDPHEVAEMVSAHPRLACAVVSLHQSYRITTAQLAAATEERFSDNSGRGSITMPHEGCATTSTNARTIYMHGHRGRTSAQMRMHHGDPGLIDPPPRVRGVRINKRIDTR